MIMQNMLHVLDQKDNIKSSRAVRIDYVEDQRYGKSVGELQHLVR